jgi:hypothetical protein
VDVHFVPADLRRFDALRSEALSVPFFEDERPFSGTLGLVDWRLSGFVSRLVLRGRISGRVGESVLLSPRPRLSFEKLFLFGLGPRSRFDETVLRDATSRMLHALTKARVRASVLVLPGRVLGLIGPVRAMEVFLEVAASHPEHDDVTLVEESDAQRAMEPVVERERRRARAYVA